MPEREARRTIERLRELLEDGSTARCWAAREHPEGNESGRPN
jgi:hypothetical protein